jgi:hypothetical protein
LERQARLASDSRDSIISPPLRRSTKDLNQALKPLSLAFSHGGQAACKIHGFSGIWIDRGGQAALPPIFDRGSEERI